MTSDDRPPVPVDDPTAEPALPDLHAPRHAADVAGTAPDDATPDDATAGTTPDEPDAADPAAVPDEATLAEIAEPARLRHAPRIGAFITTGVLAGVLVGWLLAVLGSGTSGEARTGAILLTTAGFAVLGAILGSGLAALADRRSVRRRPGSTVRR